MGAMANVHARELRKNLTDAEQRLWQKLKRRQIATVKFRRQQPIGPFIVDFVCFQRRLIIEVDGGQHAAQADYDEERTRPLNGRSRLEQVGHPRETIPVVVPRLKTRSLQTSRKVMRE